MLQSDAYDVRESRISDLPFGQRPLTVTWRKRRFRCPEAKCPARVFTETQSLFVLLVYFMNRKVQRCGQQGRKDGAQLNGMVGGARCTYECGTILRYERSQGRQPRKLKEMQVVDVEEN